MVSQYLRLPRKSKSLHACDFLKKRLLHRSFLVKFEKFLRTLILKEIWEGLLLCIDYFIIHWFLQFTISFSSIWISIITFQIPSLEPKKHKKVSVVFNEGLQRICYNELEDLMKIAKIFICLCKNQICWEPKRLTLEQLNSNNPGKLRLQCFLWIFKEYVLANWETI